MKVDHHSFSIVIKQNHISFKLPDYFKKHHIHILNQDYTLFSYLFECMGFENIEMMYVDHLIHVKIIIIIYIFN